MAEPEAMYPEFVTNGRQVRFAITTANALRPAEWLAKVAIGVPGA